MSRGTVLFLLSSVVPHMVTLQRNAIEAAREAGVQRVVKLSAFGSSSRSKATLARWHHEVENALKESGLDWTLLRPHYFTQNLLSHAKSVAEEGVMYAASGDGMMEPEVLAGFVIDGLREERFLILPHPEVLEYMRRKTDDYDRWIGGMNRLMQRLTGVEHGE